MTIKRRFHSLLLLSFCLLFVSNLTGQGKFSEGYIVTLEKDTINGLIQQGAWNINPSEIFFKRDKNSQVETYSAGAIHSFKVGKDSYRSATVEVEISPTNESQLTRSAAFNLIEETVFLKTLVSSERYLFVYRNQDKKENFYIEDYGKILLLKYKQYLILSGDQLLVRDNAPYIEQLKDFFGDCPGMDQYVDRTFYKKTSLVKLFSRYEDCLEDVDYYSLGLEVEDNKSDFGIVLGATQTNLKFRGSFNPELVNTDYESSVDPIFGLFYTFNFASRRKRWTVNNELLLTNYNLIGNHNDVVSENEFTTARIEFGYTQLKMINMARFKAIKGKVFLHLVAGLSLATTIREENYQFKTSTFFNDIKEDEGAAISDTRSFERGLVYGLGVGFKNIYLDLRWEKSTGMSALPSLGSDINRGYLALGYKF